MTADACLDQDAFARTRTEVRPSPHAPACAERHRFVHGGSSAPVAAAARPRRPDCRWAAFLCMLLAVTSAGEPRPAGAAPRTPGAEETRFGGKSASEWAVLRATGDWQVRKWTGRVFTAMGPGAVPSLLDVVARGNATARAGAARALGDLPALPAPVLSALTRALRDADAGVARAAAEALGKQGPAATAAAPLLAAALRDRGCPFRAEAAEALAGIGALVEGDVPALAALLAEEPLGTRMAAARALAVLGPKARPAVPALLRSLSGLRPIDRRDHVRALAEAGADDLLVDALGSPGKGVREGVIEALKQAGAPVARRLIAALGSADPRVRAGAAEALSGLGSGGKPGLAALRTALGDEVVLVRVQAARGIWKLDGDSAAAVPVLVQALQGGDDAARALAAGALGEIGPPAAGEAVPALAAALANEHLSVHGAALLALEKMGPTAAPAVPAIAAMRLSSDYGTTSFTAIRVLGGTGQVGVAPLIRILGAGPELVWAASRELSEIGAPAVPALAEALLSQTPTIRGGAAAALARIGPPARSAVPALLRVLRDDSPLVRQAAGRALANMGSLGESAMSGLVAGLDVRDEDRHPGVSAALAMVGKPAVPVLIAALGDPRPQVRANAARALGRMGQSAASAVPALVTALRDGEADVQYAAARALGAVGATAEQTVLALVACLGEPGRLSAVAGQALQESGRAAVPALATALHDAREPTRQEAARVLGNMGASAAAADALAAALDDPSAGVRSRAGRAFVAVAGRDPVRAPVLIRLLRGGDAPVRVAAAGALLDLGARSEEALQLLTNALADADPAVRAAAAKSLGIPLPGCRSWVPALAAVTKDSYAGVREAAVDALGEIGPAAIDGAGALVDALGDSNWCVRSGAADALAAVLPEERNRRLPWGLRPAPGTTHDPDTGLPLRAVCEADGAEMVLVPAGPFIYSRKSEGPFRAAAFYADKHEVTNARFDRFVSSTAWRCGRLAFWGDELLPDAMCREQPWALPHQGNAYPAARIVWTDAAGYCAWTGKRLPTDPEWEKAARGTDGRRYPWGNEFVRNACVLERPSSDESSPQLPARPAQHAPGDTQSVAGRPAQPLSQDVSHLCPAPVGSTPAGVSPYGCHDMVGGVWEWTAGGGWRGGGFRSLHYPTCTTRGGAGFDPIFSDYGGLETFGFRCVVGGEPWARATDESQPWPARLRAVSELLRQGDRSGLGMLRAVALGQEQAPQSARDQAVAIASECVIVHLADAMAGHPDLGPWRVVQEPVVRLLRDVARLGSPAQRAAARAALQRCGEERAHQAERRTALGTAMLGE